MGVRRGAYRVLVGKPEERDHLEYRRVGGRIILRLIFRKWDVGMDWIDLAQNRASGGTFKRSNETSSSIKCGEFLD